MPTTAEFVLIVLFLVLAAAMIVQGKRLEVLRRRSRRSMFIGPEHHLRLQKQVYERLALADCRARGVTPRLGLEFRSEWGEDVLLYDLFEGTLEGVFVEVGALDGRTLSVSWVFEAMGWTGLLVEPIPERFEECRRNRPHAQVVRAALGPSGSRGSIPFLVPENAELHGSAHRAADAISIEKMNGLQDAGTRSRAIQVPLMSMDDALTGAGFTRVDFASIDVEGAEMDVLRGFDLARFGVRVLIVEDLSLGDDESVAQSVLSRGYEQVMWIGGNRVFVRADDGELLARARRLAETVYSPLVRPRGGHNDTRRHDLR